MPKPSLVLAYHGLGRLPRVLDPHNLMVDPRRFRLQMLQLGRRGYRFVRLTEIARYLEGDAGDGSPRSPGPGGPPPGMVAVTFDDGTVDNLEVLAPALCELGIPATVFACPGLLGQAHFSMPAEAGARLMDAQELRELARCPLIDVGSHTNEHADLSGASTQEALREMAASKQALEELLQRQVDTFAYPRCRYSPACPDAARRAGYSVAVTCGGLGGWRRFELARESIDSLDGRVGFALKSRRLFRPLRESAGGRLVRAAVRPLRHGGA